MKRTGLFCRCGRCCGGEERRAKMAESLLGFLVELAGGVAVAAGVTVVVGVAVLSGSRGNLDGAWPVCFSSAVEARGFAEAARS